MDTKGFIKAPDLPLASVPMTAFLFLTGGELLVETGKESHLCYAGQLLIIPSKTPFIIRYYNNCTGYCGGFTPAALSADTGMILPAEVLHTAFWFDEGVFAGELFNMLAISYENSGTDFIARGLELLLCMAGTPRQKLTHPLVELFLEKLFDETAPILSGKDYAQACGVSLNWLNRTVKKETGRSVGGWIDTARLGRAKKLLQDGSMAIIDIASAVGLDDQSYFSRFFKRNCGMTPSEFRKRLKTKHG